MAPQVTVLEPEPVSPEQWRECCHLFRESETGTALLAEQSAHLSGDFDVWGGWQLMEGEAV
jgi:hypothetical protein